MSPKKVESSAGFSAEEKSALKERSAELKAEAKMDKDREEGEKALLAKIAEMPEPERSMAKRIHTIIKTEAPSFAPRTWYGMPAYAKDGKVVCFFQNAQKFGARYSTLGFNDSAKLDAGRMWPTAFALTELTALEEAAIAELIKRAAG